MAFSKAQLRIKTNQSISYHPSKLFHPHRICIFAAASYTEWRDQNGIVTTEFHSTRKVKSDDKFRQRRIFRDH